ncbi:MAG TPA: tRNA preQ1(34) S-adenosylmethionine ribosyltransferase-isomerase QueA, partial [Bryobacteraceae bacterium]|nr:tRNA preQ1(34) S-adenosylmethionine ribosyltransferase-isomerase QueA [Bryobacteraceae bacterium]
HTRIQSREYASAEGTLLFYLCMRLDDFDYQLPAELIAQEPAHDRDSSRMLVLYRDREQWEDRRFRELPEFLKPGDCLIVNNSRVFPSRLYGRRASGPAAIEVFLLRPVSDDEFTWEALVRPGRKVPVGETIHFNETLQAAVLERSEHGKRILRFSGAGDLQAAFAEIGHVPLPPYIKRPDTPADHQRYQTVFARETGSVAAPTAGLHFTPEVLARCSAAGAVIAPVTLHVGLGTFAPLEADVVEENRLHTERFHISACSLDTIRNAQRRVAVGTTSVRAVESAYLKADRSGETDIFIYPAYQFRAIDAMVTNFHLPRSSLLMLVAAFAGREFTLAAYAYAVRERYRFFSYGDCMLIL